MAKPLDQRTDKELSDDLKRITKSQKFIDEMGAKNGPPAPGWQDAREGLDTAGEALLGEIKRRKAKK